MSEPEELYEVDSEATAPEGAALLYYLDGFIDAGSAGSTLAEHLKDSFDGPIVARFDVDRLIDYRSRRPLMTYAGDHWASYDAPELVVRLLHDADDSPLLLLTGPEPDHEWERFAAAVRSLVERWHVRLTVNFHGIPMGVPHTRPLGITAHATRPDLVSEYRALFNDAQIPAGMASLLELRLGEAGHDALGFAAHVPHYLAQATYPAASLRLLSAIESATGLTVPADALREHAARADVEVNRQVGDSDDAAEVVEALERQYDAFNAAGPDDNLLADAEMPTGDELASQFERFLAEQQGKGEQDQ